MTASKKTLAWKCRATGAILLGGKEIHLSPQEARIIERLMKARGQPVAPEAMVFAVWNGSDREPAGAISTVNVDIFNIRKKGLPVGSLPGSQITGYWLESIEWFSAGQRYSTPAGVVTLRQVFLEPALVFLSERTGVTASIALSDKRIEGWEAL
jgi:hypothetical protein